ncbi:MAG: T9SS type A sorting domain-containing protein [Rhodothermia bacterium]|nr:T9SS type A sorting domain-containing protein [Rhodothermia bacterium]
MKKRVTLVLVLGCVLLGNPLMAQQMKVVTSTVADDVTLDIFRPQIAAASDGSYAVAWEALIESEFSTSWRIGVQRLSSTGNPVGPTNYFLPESFCLPFDSWQDDGQSNVELAFAPNGALLVLMQHWGLFDIIGDFMPSSEITLGVVQTSGSILDLSSAGNCLQHKFIFPGADEQDRPRMAIGPDATLFLTMDGFFNQTDLRNVGLDIYDGSLNDLVQGELIPHDDPSSLQAFHMWPDVASNGSLILSVWNECPIVDPQGNANECDIGAQFARLMPTGLQVVGSNVVVNTGDPAGTINWRPAAAMNPAGASVVVWQDFRTGAQGDVFGQLFNASGQPVGGNIQISTSTGFVETWPDVRPEVAMLDDGGFMVVWGDSSAVGFRAHGRQYSSGGAPLTPPFMLDTTPGIQTGVPSVSTDGTNYYYVVLGRTPTGDLSVRSNPPTSTANDRLVPENLSTISSAYPNPFTTEATIEFELSAPAPVRVVLYDVMGRLVKTVVDDYRAAGVQRIALDGTGLAAGVYLATVDNGDVRRSHMLLRR